MKEKIENIIGKIQTDKKIQRIIIIVGALFAAFLLYKIGTNIAENVNTKKLECTYESKVSDYSKLKIQETITNYFRDGKRIKMKNKSVYTILNKDKDTLESMKKEKKVYSTAFKDIKGVSGSYKANGYKITTKVTYQLKKMEDSKKQELNISLSDTYSQVKEYYENYGYTCK